MTLEQPKEAESSELNALHMLDTPARISGCDTQGGGDPLALQGDLHYLVLSTELCSRITFHYEIAEDKAEMKE